MVGDLETCKLSEVAWRGGAEGSGERFLFDHPTVCAVYRAGELTLIEYGKNDVSNLDAAVVSLCCPSCMPGRLACPRWFVFMLWRCVLTLPCPRRARADPGSVSHGAPEPAPFVGTHQRATPCD